MDKDEAKKILIANLKGSKKKRVPLLTIAAAVRFLANDKEYGSTSKLAEGFGVKRPTIESFDKMNDQPDKIKKLIEEGKIGIDANTKLSTIPDQENRVKLAKTIAGLSAIQTRLTISYFKKHPNLSPEDCKNAIINSKPTEKQGKSVIIHLKSEDHEAFIAASKKAGLKPEEAGKQAIFEWMKKLR